MEQRVSKVKVGNLEGVMLCSVISWDCFDDCVDINCQFGVKFFNVTNGHPVCIILKNGFKYIIPFSGQTARVYLNGPPEKIEKFSIPGWPHNNLPIDINKIEINKKTFGFIKGLPEPDPEKRTYYISSQIVALVAGIIGRDDVLMGDGNVYNEFGKKRGCRSLTLPIFIQ